MSTTAFQHRPMSKILAPLPEDPELAPTSVRPEAATQEQQAVPPTIPDKYKDKSLAEVIDMHQNAEKEIGRSRNEIGQYRGLVKSLSQLQRTPEHSVQEQQEKLDVSGDDLIADPVGTIRAVVKQDLEALAAKADDQRLDALVEAENSMLLRDFPDLDATVGSDEFKEFATRTSGRQVDFNSAATGEGLGQVRAARRLLEDYEDFNRAMKPSKTQTAVQAAQQVATESGTGGSKPQHVSGDLIYEADVISLIASNPAKYRSPSYQDSLMAAIREGRFVKN